MEGISCPMTRNHELRHDFGEGDVCPNYCSNCGGCSTYSGPGGVQASCPYNNEEFGILNICICGTATS